jgi:hypothetical protein
MPRPRTGPREDELRDALRPLLERQRDYGDRIEQLFGRDPWPWVDEALAALDEGEAVIVTAACVVMALDSLGLPVAAKAANKLARGTDEPWTVNPDGTYEPAALVVA